MENKDLSYEEGRLLVKDGSLVFFKARKWSQRLVTLFTGGKYSHCGILVWMESQGQRRLMLVEAFVGGTRIINLRSYSDRDMLILDLGVDWANSEASKKLLDKTGRNPYGFLDFISIGVKDLSTKIGFPVRMPNFAGEVCSELVANYLIDNGFLLIDSCISPNTLLCWLRSVPVVSRLYLSDEITSGERKCEA